MFRAKSDKVQNQQLKVEQVDVRFSDTQLYVVSASDVILLIGESVSEAVSVLFQDDSLGTLTPIAAASLSVVDSSAYTAGGDRKAIKVASVTLAASDLLYVRFIPQS